MILSHAESSMCMYVSVCMLMELFPSILKKPTPMHIKIHDKATHPHTHPCKAPSISKCFYPPKPHQYIFKILSIIHLPWLSQLCQCRQEYQTLPHHKCTITHILPCLFMRHNAHCGNVGSIHEVYPLTHQPTDASIISHVYEKPFLQ